MRWPLSLATFSARTWPAPTAVSPRISFCMARKVPSAGKSLSVTSDTAPLGFQSLDLLTTKIHDDKLIAVAIVLNWLHWKPISLNKFWWCQHTHMIWLRHANVNHGHVANVLGGHLNVRRLDRVRSQRWESKNHLSPHLPVPEGPPDHQATAWQFHLTQTQLVACDIRQSAWYLEHSYLIHNLDNGASGSSQQANLGCAAMVVKARPQPGHWAQFLVVAPQACRAKLALLPSSGYGSNSNSAHSTSWNVDLVEWHMNCILQFVHEHQPNAVEVAPDLEVVQNPSALSLENLVNLLRQEFT